MIRGNVFFLFEIWDSGDASEAAIKRNVTKRRENPLIDVITGGEGGGRGIKTRREPGFINSRGKFFNRRDARRFPAAIKRFPDLTLTRQ